jgi:cell division protein FtsZ
MLFDVPIEKRSIIKVIGVGGGGTNAVNHMFNQGIEGVEFAITNTDVQSMEESPITIKIQLGPVLTEGRGAGSKPEVGKEACIESIDYVREFLNDGTKMLFITAGLGGGTGTGAAPIVAKAAKDLGVLTVAIVTLPFQFEGQRRMRQALEGLVELKKNVDSILVISNDKLRNMFGNLQLSDAFGQADQILTTAAKGIAEIITLPGYINVDFEDVNTVIRDSGVAIMGSAEKDGENRAREAIDAALNSPLLEDNDIRGAKHILLNISSGAKEVTMDEVAEITEYIQEEAGRGTDLIWGNCRDESLGDKLSVTLIATGFEEGSKDTKKMEKTRVVSLDEGAQIEEMDGFEIGFDDAKDHMTVEFDEDDVKKTINTYGKYNDNTGPFVKENTPEELRRQKIRELEEKRKKGEFGRDFKVSPDVPIDNPANIKNLEKVPAYKRRQITLDEVKSGDDAENDNYRVTIDSDEVIESNNSYLHDNVD